eukprot:CAMPEP_0206466784 /NCGR_PEP_ID=MMETSP0324_2-20121206/28665_1 /ASSEMBLY_ACC=CAM_ASM_000836 /TAXON_ID=2866 /ORGANISM="Crypthecodinium cohnii, Strain Seligo" /LENGTH=441 /DNA_ID=CAMNT_0053939967 /DNA_START=78 /DNA_END=1403 /DNA_ORIENTATION=+
MPALSKSAILAAALALAAPVLKPDLVQKGLSRFDRDADAPLPPLRRFSASTAAAPSNVSHFDAAISVPSDGVIATAATPFLVILSPADVKNPPNGRYLSEFLESNRMWFKDLFFEYGSVIFRGFDIPDAASFEQVVLGITTELATVYLGTSPRSSINGTTYVHTAADFPPHRTLPTHLEMSFRDNPPRTQMFYAHRVEQERGGETPLTNFEGVWETIKANPKLRAKYEHAKVKYIRNNDDCNHQSSIDPLMQKCWQDMFKTDDRSKVLEQCKAEQFDCQFLDNWNGRVRITNVQPFVRKHPVTGKTVWFNHINVLTRNSMVYDYERTAALWGGFGGLWPLGLALYYRALFGVLTLVWSEFDFGFGVANADDTVIPEEDLRAIKRAVWQNTFQAPYQKNDIVIVDNMKVGHGREMYVGNESSRLIMTAWADNYPSSWFPEGQ